MNKIDNTKKILKDFIPEIDGYLEKVWKKELLKINFDYKDIQDLSKYLLEHAKEHNMRTAKRLRANFVFSAYKMLGGTDSDAIMGAAASVELVHTALLMQDDFADRDDFRRGLTTTHKYFEKYHEKNLSRGESLHYGNSIAVFLGDIVLTLGYKLMNEVDFDPKLAIKATSKLFDAIIETGYGEIYDITIESRSKATEEDVINLHHAKTSIYTYQNPLHVGATLAGASDDDLELISKYAIPGGIAFQLQDDVLGIFGDSEKTGKSDFADIKEGKQTLLMIKAIENATDTQKVVIDRIWGNPEITEKEADVMREIIVDTGSLNYSKETAERYARNSQEVIPEMKKRGWDDRVVDFLDGVAEYMAVGRDK